jgi:hypothetical protein
MEQTPSPKVIESSRTIERHLRQSVETMIISGLNRDAILWILTHNDGEIDREDVQAALIYVNGLLISSETRENRQLEPLPTLIAVQRALTYVSSFLIHFQTSNLCEKTK